MKTIADLLEFLDRLRRSHIHYSLAQFRDETIAIVITVPGQRWEVEVAGDGSVKVEKFTSGGQISDASVLEELFREFSD